YMSPEQATNQHKVDARTDQYSLGIVTYQCVTGVHPFDQASPYAALFQIMKGVFKPAREVAPELPPPLLSLLDTALSTSPDNRYASMAAFAQPLLDAADEATAARWRPVFEPSTALVPVALATPDILNGVDYSNDSADASLSFVVPRAGWFTRWWRPLGVVLSLCFGTLGGYFFDAAKFGNAAKPDAMHPAVVGGDSSTQDSSTQDSPSQDSPQRTEDPSALPPVHRPGAIEARSARTASALSAEKSDKRRPPTSSEDAETAKDRGVDPTGDAPMETSEAAKKNRTSSLNDARPERKTRKPKRRKRRKPVQRTPPAKSVEPKKDAVEVGPNDSPILPPS
ncbi:MAG: hypothetical protein AAFV29_27125, partial [Myxococcota bacterium]